MFLVTGCAGFIGFHLSKKLLDNGNEVVGIDDLNDYYDVKLKNTRLDILKQYENFIFHKEDLSQRNIDAVLKKYNNQFLYVFHLAAQAGVRYSIENPYAYINSNITAQLNLLEFFKTQTQLKHFIYASTSSVYGANTKLPFDVDDKTDSPMSMYAVSKKSCELMAYAYASLFKIPLTGFRFFTVYGPYGRPDMAASIFSDAIVKNKALPLFNNGIMKRNFTYIDDIIEGLIRSYNKSPSMEVPFALYNLGNDKSENLMDFLNLLEVYFDKKAIVEMMPMQKGDVFATLADISSTTKDFGFLPKTNIEEGLKKFSNWYRDYYNV